MVPSFVVSFLVTTSWLFVTLATPTSETSIENKNKKPNILFIFTDDQDARMDTLEYMPNLQKYLIQEGTLYRNHYATSALCCPSRVSLLRGQYAHNTNITDVGMPYGGYERYNELQLGEDYLPIWMQKAGYSTHYIGKLMNKYSVNNYNKPIPAGFDYQDQLVDPYTYVYNTAVFSKDGEEPVYFNNTYQTDVIHTKAVDALKKQRNTEKPFFLWVAPIAPHGQFVKEGDINDLVSTRTEPPEPAARHAHLFQDVKVPRHPNFNPVNQTKTASYWKEFSYLNETQVKALDEAYRKRLQSLQAVDEMIPSLIQELEFQGKLENTFIIFSSDNGFHLGQHRAPPGKATDIEEDINVPLVVRGPGVRKRHISDLVSSHHDIAPTFLALAKGDHHVPSWVDGGVIPWIPKLRNHPKPVSRESFAVEFWMDKLIVENVGASTRPGWNTYKTLRVISDKYNYKYAVWCTGERELYNMQEDPYEINNLYTSDNAIDLKLIDRLDALLSVLKACRAHTCRNPWPVIHPNDPDIVTLKDALHKKYDEHYKQLSKFNFSKCLGYYSIENEEHMFDDRSLLSNNQKNVQLVTKRQIHFDIEESGEKRCSVQQHSSNDVEQVTDKEVTRLFNLVPRSEEPVGHAVPTSEELKKIEQRVPDELLKRNVDWVKYGFYNRFGN
ncbi:alkaline-phosphatase-like protein [Phascolomyces articulosus]|uniref:Alkaline-phosphatase-like protein n=1 Tax=Phascolomyces articulosus TaxID=60185 RepID=A0AAD5P9V8_9FUNG|nr:alkaline-phosphatase-like protein [Phascolomyces articulosus]